MLVGSDKEERIDYILADYNDFIGTEKEFLEEKLIKNMENIDEAITDLKKAISINENYYKYYRTLGTVYFNNKDYDKAIDSIRKAYSLNENDVLSLNNAACYYVMIDKDIWRGYSNIESAYNDMPSDLDEEAKNLITNNYKAIKKVYDKYVNDENTVINLDNLELAY